MYINFILKCCVHSCVHMFTRHSCVHININRNYAEETLGKFTFKLLASKSLANGRTWQWECGNHNREKFGHLKNQLHLPNVTSMWCLHKHLYETKRYTNTCMYICDRACKNRPSECKKSRFLALPYRNLITFNTTTTKSSPLLQNLMGFLVQLTEMG